MQRVTALVRRPTIEAADLAFLGLSRPVEAEPAFEAGLATGTLDEAVTRLETDMIRRALVVAGGNRTEAARRLGIHRQLLHTKLRRYGLDPSGNRTDVGGAADAESET